MTSTNDDDDDDGEESWGPFVSVHQAAEWASQNLDKWWWIIRIHDPNLKDGNGF